MKKSFVSVAIAALLALSFSAQAADVTAKVGATTNFVDRGVSYSDEGASVNATLKATAGNIFGEVTTATMTDRFHRESMATVGYTTAIAGVELVGGYQHRFYTGKTFHSNKDNFGEVFAQASFKGLNAQVFQTVDTTAYSGKDTYSRFGYTAPAFLGFTVDVGTAYTHYRDEGVTRHTNTEIGVSYNVTKNVKAVALHSFGGKNVHGYRLDDQTAFGVSIGF